MEDIGASMEDFNQRISIPLHITMCKGRISVPLHITSCKPHPSEMLMTIMIFDNVGDDDDEDSHHLQVPVHEGP
eukprot:10934879-Karenia_brevis.AAC.1